MRNVIWAVSVLVLVGAGAAVHADHHQSGFLDDYSQLKPDEGRKGGMVYRKEGASLAKYDKIALAPIEIWLSPTSKYEGLSPDELKALADAFATEVVKQLEPTYPVVGTAGDGVLQVRIAIANITLKKRSAGCSASCLSDSRLLRSKTSPASASSGTAP